MERTSAIAPVNAGAQLEAIRTLLVSVHHDLTGSENPSANLEELIASLLSKGMTRREIGFLFGEAMPIGAKG